MSSDIRVGILGYGIAGRVFHAPLVSATPGMTVAAIVTRAPERQAQAKAENPGATILSSADELFRLPLDLVVVATPNRTHVSLALAAIDAGIAVVVDKPFAPTADEARRIRDAANERGVRLTVFQNRRWDSDFRTVSKVIAEGALGDVHRFESRYERWVPEIWDNWRESGAPEEAGGVLYDLGAHLVDQALHLFGPVSTVYAETDLRRPGVAVDDDAFVALTHANGVRSHLWMSLTAAQHGPRFRVLGSKAAFTIHGLDSQEDALAAGQRPGDPGWGKEPETTWGALGVLDDTQPVPTELGAYQQFYESVRDGEVPVGPESAEYALHIIEAAFTSARTGKVVSP
ncbi:Gfo/Idh/MocA family oxidoreductase [Actinocrispum sp. NPDC049592]|uniref:Gfo/Idh/MocA family protein n=1 Tax=Actinocrispum sp. NPDC049592 TaxID=3154835 RepID=UPI0034337973